MKRLLFAAAALFGVATSAQAITPVLVDIDQQGSMFEFTYEATLTEDEGVRTGDRLVIYDFAGFLGFGVNPNPASVETFTENTTSVGGIDNVQQPPGFFDDPNLPNLVFRWSGPPAFVVGPHPAFDFVFSAFSSLGGMTFDGYSSLTVTNNGPNAGQSIYTQGGTAVPAAIVPEPASWAMMIAGFGGVGALLRRRRAAFTPTA
jgi:hypothetical protein